MNDEKCCILFKSFFVSLEPWALGQLVEMLVNRGLDNP